MAAVLSRAVLTGPLQGLQTSDTTEDTPEELTSALCVVIPAACVPRQPSKDDWNRLRPPSAFLVGPLQPADVMAGWRHRWGSVSVVCSVTRANGQLSGLCKEQG